LKKLAPRVARRLAPGGFLVLAGLLRDQEPLVLSAYRQHGIRLAGRIRFGGWSILVLAKGGSAMLAQRPGWH
jgi:ribosomal protein L11 methyltransferase